MHAIFECFHTRADSKLQWRIVCDIWITESTHGREKTSLRWVFSIPERGEEAWLVSVFFWHADCYFISIRKCVVYWRLVRRSRSSASQTQFRGQGIHTALLLHDVRDVSLENSSGPSFDYANLRTQMIKWSVTRMIIRITHFALVWKPSYILM